MIAADISHPSRQTLCGLHIAKLTAASVLFLILHFVLGSESKMNFIYLFISLI